jgi:endoglycosylceramidase
VDGEGRVVLLHGVNAVWKRAPYAPPATPAGFTARDADWLAAQGFNTVRLGVIFAGVMPRRGVVDQGYLDRVQRVVDLLAARRIWVLLDFHQDMYNEKFSGEGFPAWAVHDDGLRTPGDAGSRATTSSPPRRGRSTTSTRTSTASPTSTPRPGGPSRSASAVRRTCWGTTC